MKKRNLTLVLNWKANPETPQKARTLLRRVKSALPKQKGVDVVVCPPELYISDLAGLSRSVRLKVGAQDLSLYDGGAHTGETTAQMLKESGVGIALVGHSERRAEGDTDKGINKKITMALKYNMEVILCVGETIRDHDGEYFSHVKSQIEKAFKGIPKSKAAKVSIAYEPVWAISSKGKHADSPESFVEMSIFIRKILNNLYGKTHAMKTTILYGGSVNEKNAEGFLMHKETQGFLIGKAGLDPVKVKALVQLANALR